MPLPELGTEDHYAVYPSVPEWLRAVHEGVMVLGIGNCEVQAQDDPATRMIGFGLSRLRDQDDLGSWFFQVGLITIKQMNAALRTRYQHLFRTAEARRNLANMLTAGWNPDTASYTTPLPDEDDVEPKSTWDHLLEET